MKLNFRATTPDDRGAVTELLLRGFGARPGTSLDDAALMHWKYWQARSDWQAYGNGEVARSYVMEHDGRIVAHAGLWPMPVGEARVGEVRGVQMIDWAADPAFPGAGLALVQKFAARFDFIYSIGGSDATRRLLPALGFSEVAKAWTGARPIRPLQQILTHQTRNWKLGARLVRNALWSGWPRRVEARGWRLAGMEGEAVRNELCEALCWPRTAGFFAYVRACPTVRVELYRIVQGDETQGYTAIAVVRKQARIGGVWVKNGDIERLRMAYGLAEGAARRMKGVNEVSAKGSGERSRRAAELAGFRMVGEEPVYLLNKKGKLVLPEGFQFQMLDDDALFVDFGSVIYQT